MKKDEEMKCCHRAFTVGYAGLLLAYSMLGYCVVEGRYPNTQKSRKCSFFASLLPVSWKAPGAMLRRATKKDRRVPCCFLLHVTRGILCLERKYCIFYNL